MKKCLHCEKQVKSEDEHIIGTIRGYAVYGCEAEKE